MINNFDTNKKLFSFIEDYNFKKIEECNLVNNKYLVFKKNNIQICIKYINIYDKYEDIYLNCRNSAILINENRYSTEYRWVTILNVIKYLKKNKIINISILDELSQKRKIYEKLNFKKIYKKRLINLSLYLSLVIHHINEENICNTIKVKILEEIR